MEKVIAILNLRKNRQYEMLINDLLDLIKLSENHEGTSETLFNDIFISNESCKNISRLKM